MIISRKKWVHKKLPMFHFFDRFVNFASFTALWTSEAVQGTL